MIARPFRLPAHLLAALTWVLLAWAATTPAVAQTPDPPSLEVELRGGGSAGKLSSTASGMEFDPGLALAGAVMVPVTEFLAGYIGYSRVSFGCSEGFCSGADVELGSHGASAGVEARWRSLRVFGGGLLHEGRSTWRWYTGTPDDGPARGSSRSGWGLGLEAGAGIRVPVRDGFSVAPGFRYSRFRASFPDSPREPGADGDVMSHLTVEMGVRFALPEVGR